MDAARRSRPVDTAWCCVSRARVALGASGHSALRADMTTGRGGFYSSVESEGGSTNWIRQRSASASSLIARTIRS